jgi:hypothetical protein
MFVQRGLTEKPGARLPESASESPSGCPLIGMSGKREDVGSVGF